MRMEKQYPFQDYQYRAFEAAYKEAQAAFENDEVPVGAAIIYQQNILTSERNRIVELRDPTAHAELLAIKKAASLIQNERLNECELVTTLEPCAMCSGAIILARIPVVYYLAEDEKLPALRSVCALKGHNHIPEMHYVNAHEFAAKELLQKFFKNKREVKSIQARDKN